MTERTSQQFIHDEKSRSLPSPQKGELKEREYSSDLVLSD